MFGALSRLLREEGIKDAEIGINIIYIFFCFSNFTQFHPFLSQNRVGDTCMKMIETELDKLAKLEEELKNIRSEKKSSRKLEMLSSEIKIVKMRQEPLLSGILQAETTHYYIVCFHLLLNLAEDVSIERKMKKRNIVTRLVQILDW
jgi:hypothetical protein